MARRFGMVESMHSNSYYKFSNRILHHIDIHLLCNQHTTFFSGKLENKFFREKEDNRKNLVLKCEIDEYQII